MEERKTYFEEALGDFVHEAASGRAIRHLVDLGYSLDQIMESLSYPTPRQKAQETACRYMKESGVLLFQMPEDLRELACKDTGRMRELIHQKRKENGEKRSYVSCPFQAMGDEASLQERLKGLGLNSRESGYLAGIVWERPVMYHRLTGRMLEISDKLLLTNRFECAYYFLETREKIVRTKE